MDRRAAGAARASPPPLADGDRVALLDEELELSVRGGARRSSVRREGRRLAVALAPAGDLDGIVERWYRQEAGRALGAGARGAARGGASPPSRSAILAAVGELRLDRAPVVLLAAALAPEAVADHVVAHEVCHLVRPDHSPAFWALVEEIARCPRPARLAARARRSAPPGTGLEERQASRRVRRRARTARADSAPAIAAIPNARRAVIPA